MWFFECTCANVEQCWGEPEWALHSRLAKASPTRSQHMDLTGVVTPYCLCTTYAQVLLYIRYHTVKHLSCLGSSLQSHCLYECLAEWKCYLLSVWSMQLFQIMSKRHNTYGRCRESTIHIASIGLAYKLGRYTVIIAKVHQRLNISKLNHLLKASE